LPDVFAIFSRSDMSFDEGAAGTHASRRYPYHDERLRQGHG
jgi:hypothetical protein